MSPAGPSKIGKYEVEERVGEGAMGVVYRAVDPVLQRRVAIKVMSDAIAQSGDLRERFLREAQAAGSLQHPNVITIYDFGEVEGHPYIAMEFVEGQDVAELLAHSVPMTTAAKLDLAIGVLHGLAFAHRRGIVHRDIKPANIRIDSDGKARIMDFGVAHLASSEMTRSGVMLGTPSYMAPEQITGGKVGPHTDIFSVGAVLYELLTGIRPFEGGALQAVMYRILSEAPASINSIVPTLPPQLNGIVMKALAKEPEERYATALDMANDLLAIRTTLDTSSASPATLSLRATIDSALDVRRSQDSRRIRQRRLAISGIAVGGAAVLVLAGWFLARNVNRGATTGDVAAPPAAATTPTPAATLAGAPASAPVQSPAAAAPRAAPSTNVQKTSGTQTATTARPLTRSPEQIAPTSGPAVSAPPPAAAPSLPASDVRSIAPAPVVTSQSAAGNPAPVNPTPPPSTAPAPTAANATSVNAGAEIGTVIDTYARAIETRDMAELRRVYSAITPAQASAFSDFFGSTRTLRAALAVKSVQVDGATARARVSGTYEFTTTAGRTQQQPVNFEAELRREGSAWKLVAVR